MQQSSEQKETDLIEEKKRKKEIEVGIGIPGLLARTLSHRICTHGNVSYQVLTLLTCENNFFLGKYLD